MRYLYIGVLKRTCEKCSKEKPLKHFWRYQKYNGKCNPCKGSELANTGNMRRSWPPKRRDSHVW